MRLVIGRAALILLAPVALAFGASGVVAGGLPRT
jgi:hypothetical protein